MRKRSETSDIFSGKQAGNHWPAMSTLSALLLAVTSFCAQSSLLLHKPKLSQPDPNETPKTVWQAFEIEKGNGFSSRTSMLPVMRRLAAVGSSAVRDPCKADILANGLCWPYGFGARALVLANELEVAMYFNASVALCDGDKNHEGMGWSRHFQNLAGLAVCTDLEVCSARRSRMRDVHHVGFAMAKELTGTDHHFQTRVRKELYHALFTYSPDMLAKVDASLISSGLKSGSQFVGVHVRRGDKKSTRDLPMDEYAFHVAQALRWYRSDAVYVASDDPEAGHELHTLLEPEFPELRLFQAEASATRKYNGEDEDLLPMLTDLEALRRADVYVGSRKSSFGRTAFFLRQMSQASISIDGDWLTEAGVK